MQGFIGILTFYKLFKFFYKITNLLQKKIFEIQIKKAFYIVMRKKIVVIHQNILSIYTLTFSGFNKPILYVQY